MFRKFVGGLGGGGGGRRRHIIVGLRGASWGTCCVRVSC